MQMGLHGPKEHKTLNILSNVLEPRGCELVVYSDDILFDDGALIQVLGSIMGSRSDHLYPSLICSQIGIGPLEGGQEGMVNIDEATAKGVNELG